MSEALDIEQHRLRFQALKAIRSGEIDRLRGLLEDGLDPTYAHEESGESVLGVAAAETSVDALGVLLESSSGQPVSKESLDPVLANQICQLAVMAGSATLISQMVRLGFESQLGSAAKAMPSMTIEPNDEICNQGMNSEMKISSAQARSAISAPLGPLQSL